MASTKLMITVAPTGGKLSKGEETNIPAGPGQIGE